MCKQTERKGTDRYMIHMEEEKERETVSTRNTGNYYREGVEEGQGGRYIERVEAVI